jgi:alanine dehydrogenase
MNLKIGILRETKVPADRRVPLLPYQCVQIQKTYPGISFIIQPSDVRCVHNNAYLKEGLIVQENLNDCDILMGVKEVSAHDLMSNKTYFFFSHTIKKQPHNQKLFQTILKRSITLIDYETIVDENNNRLVAFGKFAGIVGAYNGLLFYGKKTNAYELPRANKLESKHLMIEALKNIQLPPIRIAVLGKGRVGMGAREFLLEAGITEVTKESYLSNNSFNTTVFSVFTSEDYYRNKYDHTYNSNDFKLHPESYEGYFLPIACCTDLLIYGPFWNPSSPLLFSTSEMQSEAFKIKFIADITCDIKGSLPSTVKSTNLFDPIYDFNPKTLSIENPNSQESNIGVMAIDNLPCEMPKDASEDFGNQLIQYVFPALAYSKKNPLLIRSAITIDGKLTPKFKYLADYALNK